MLVAWIHCIGGAPEERGGALSGGRQGVCGLSPWERFVQDGRAPRTKDWHGMVSYHEAERGFGKIRRRAVWSGGLMWTGDWDRECQAGQGPGLEPQAHCQAWKCHGYKRPGTRLPSLSIYGRGFNMSSAMRTIEHCL